jgi:hypothetical protein
MAASSLPGPAERCDAADMTSSRRDVEQDIRVKLGRNARTEVLWLRTSSASSVDAAIDRLVTTAHGSPDGLRDAVDLRGPEVDDEDVETRGAQALLRRAVRRAADPQPQAPPKPFLPPDAPRRGRSDDPA